MRFLSNPASSWPARSGPSPAWGSPRCCLGTAGRSLPGVSILFVLAVGRRLRGSLSPPHSVCSYSLLVAGCGAVSLCRIRSVRTRCWSRAVGQSLSAAFVLFVLAVGHLSGSVSPISLFCPSFLVNAHTAVLFRANRCSSVRRTVVGRDIPRVISANTQHEQNGYRRVGAPAPPPPTLSTNRTDIAARGPHPGPDPTNTVGRTHPEGRRASVPGKAREKRPPGCGGRPIAATPCDYCGLRRRKAGMSSSSTMGLTSPTVPWPVRRRPQAGNSPSPKPVAMTVTRISS